MTRPSASTRTAELSFDADRIVLVTIKEGAQVGLADAKENHEATQRLVGQGRFFVLIDARHARSIDRAAREFLSDPRVRKGTVAEAILVDSAVSRVLGNFFLGLNKGRFPSRLFSDSDEARQWLLGFTIQ